MSKYGVFLSLHRLLEEEFFNHHPEMDNAWMWLDVDTYVMELNDRVGYTHTSLWVYLISLYTSYYVSIIIIGMIVK